MHGYTTGVQLVGTITVGASASETIEPVRENSPFKNLSICIRPEQTDSQYKVAVYQDGELSEEHDYPSADGDDVIAHMHFPDIMFPANIGENAIPKFYTPDRKDYEGIPFSVVLTNHETSRRTFFVYVLYESFGDNCRFGEVKQ